MRSLTVSEIILVREILSAWLTIGVMVIMMDYLVIGFGKDRR